MKPIIKFILVFTCFIYVNTFLAKANTIDTLPQIQNFGHVSTEWNEFDYVSATDQIPLVQAPVINSGGSASLDFPIKLPLARNDFMPDLSINYDSEAANSWLGKGWDLTISSFEIDTRWGVPRYDENIETEIYLYNGQQLGPVFHRAAEYEREEDRTFFVRQEKNFSTIIRHGNGPTNYWWEVREKNGTTRFYGGTPQNGSSSEYQLHTSMGNIFQWKLAEMHDRLGNYIQYTYGKYQSNNGENIYPTQIIYNGKDGNPGSYSVTFILSGEDREDITISARTGSIITEAKLLERIEIYYKSQLVRAYSLGYKSGAFKKTLLESISEYNQDNQLFYNYNFDYHNEIEQGSSWNIFSSKEDWNVPKDNIPVGSISGNIDGFNAKPTILGGSTATSTGAGLAITVGFTGNPTTKDFTAGPNGGFSNSQGSGVTTLIDIDGDGLPDKLWKEESGIFYRKNLSRLGNLSFGPRTQVEGISEYSASKTFEWNVGAELNLPGIYAGYTHEEATNTVSHYFSDFNGDELIDVVINGQVFFNSISSQGIPSFTKNSGETPSPISKGEPLDPDLINTDPAAQAMLEGQFPLHDVVRMWVAPKDGTITITGDVQLVEDLSEASLNNTTKDGVEVMIQVEGVELWRERIEADDFAMYSPPNVPINISQGDEIYFRVNSFYDGSYDEVLWNPTITYSNEDQSIQNIDQQLIHVYNAEEDFLISEKRPMKIIKGGTIKISGNIVKNATSDSITIHISSPVNYHKTFLASEIVDEVWELDEIVVSGDEDLEFSITSPSIIDWTEVKWEPIVEYTSFTDGSDAYDSDGQAVLRNCASVYIDSWLKKQQLGHSFTAIDSGMMTCQFQSLGILNGTCYANFKSAYFPDSIIRDTFMALDPNVIELQRSVTAGEILSLDVVYSSHVGVIIASGECKINDTIQPIEIDVNTKTNDVSKGHLYRGWGQFIYDGNDGRKDFPIMEIDLAVDTMEAAQDTSLVDENTSTGELEGAQGSNDVFFIMSSDPKLLAWQGSDEFVYLTGTKISSSRNGQKYVGTDAQNQEPSDDFTAPSLISKTKSDGGMGGLGYGPATVSAGYTAMNSYSVLDVLDMNGDQYPDYLAEFSIQYTNFRGGMTNEKFEHEWGCHNAFSEAYFVGLGSGFASSGASNSGSSPGKGSYKKTNRSKSKTRRSTSKAKSANESAENSIGISGGVGEDFDHTTHTFLDINGDGLEDKIWENGDVALNVGYSFAEIRKWNFGKIRAGNSLDFGAGLGINIANESFMAGVSVSRTTNESTHGLVDMNDDALLDYVYIDDNDVLQIQFNTGVNFMEPIACGNIDQFDGSVSIGESINAGITIPLLFFFIKICINPTFFTGQGTSAIYTTFQDIDGDGLVDYLQAENADDNLQVRRNSIGKTNLLKSVTNPINGEILLDYDIAGNTYDLPFALWTLKSAVVRDGVSGDGVDSLKTVYQYSKGKYDRHERQFYGFGEVEERVIAADSVARKIIVEYDVSNFYTKGLNIGLTIEDNNGRYYSKTENTYQLRDIATGVLLPPGYEDKDDGGAFAALAQSVQKIQEVDSDNTMTMSEIYQYDSLGNIIYQSINDESGYNQIIEWAFWYNQENHIFDNPRIEKVSSDGIVVQHTAYEYDQAGNMTVLKQRIDNSNTAISNFEYDDYGNIIMYKKPEDSQGNRFIIESFYDEIEHQFLQKEIDGYGYTTEYSYDYLYNKLTSYTDINNNITSYSLDKFGRNESTLKPMDAEAGRPYSMRYEYSPFAEVAFSKTYHNDPEYGEDFLTYQFEDGLKREIQTKRQAFIINQQTSPKLQLIVSGTEIFDHFGRVVKEFLPITEPMSNGPIFNSDTSQINAVTTSYDLLDRVIEIQGITGGISTISYVISPDNLGNMLSSITTIDGLGNITTEYYSLRNDLVSQQIHTGEENIWTNYKYDGTGLVTDIIDPYGNTSSYSYDLLGRRISVDIRDAGETTLKYDNAGNLIERQTATIRNTIPNDGSIRYSYDNERLTRIDYPKNFQNKVQIHYGSVQDSFQRTGRIKLLEESTGGREFYYDKNGNPTKIIQTVIINRSEIYTYVTEFMYDSKGRIKELIYPDGEKVSYFYDRGGKLTRMEGSKASKSYNYVDEILYDLYEDTREITYGNGTIDKFNFDDKGRIEERITQVENTTVFHESYTYDVEDNVKTKKNIAGEVNGIGGSSEESFMYDELHRMSEATGLWSNNSSQENYSVFFDYNRLSNLTMKGQDHQVNGQQELLTSRFIDFEYDNNVLPGRPTTIGGKSYNYDDNGNLLLSNSTAIFDFDQNIYDEENRLMGSSNNGYISRYSYDAFGRRIIKSHGEFQGIFINGAAAGLVEHNSNYQVDLSPHFTVYKNEYRKHYFVGNTRIATKIGTGKFQTALASGPQISAGGIDYKQRIVAYEQSILDYYENLGIPPGPPSLLALNGQPEINFNSLPDANANNPYYTPPSNWPNIPEPDTSGPPGAPVFYNFDSQTNESVQAGYNFTDGAITEELEQFFYHYDNINSTRYISGSDGLIRQHIAYFPSGEIWIKQSNTLDESQYLFGSKSLDKESDLYYLGEIYYDPAINMDLSVDNTLQNFGELTFQTRQEGTLLYDFANINITDTEFDIQILNTERPDPFLLNSVPIFPQIEVEDDDEDDDSDDLTESKNKKRKKKRNRKTKKRTKKKKATKNKVSTQSNLKVQNVKEELAVKQLQSPEGFEPNTQKKMKRLLKDSRKRQTRKENLKKRKKNNKMKVRFKA